MRPSAALCPVCIRPRQLSPHARITDHVRIGLGHAGNPCFGVGQRPIILPHTDELAQRVLAGEVVLAVEGSPVSAEQAALREVKAYPWLFVLRAGHVAVTEIGRVYMEARDA